MKCYTCPLIALFCIVSFGAFAQLKERPADAKMRNMEFVFDAVPAEDLVVVSYHVEERINLNMGTRITTYNVPSLNFVDSYDLGPNNTRVVTPKYGNARVKAAQVQSAAVALSFDRPKAWAEILVPVTVPATKEVVTKKTGQASAYIDITDTYERILIKGYKSVDMLKRVANGRFFDGDLTKAAKWYTELFALTSDLEEAYYYRYAQALKSIRQIDKANEMMAIFESRMSKNRKP